MVAAAAAASRAPADAVKPTSASRRVMVFPMGVVIADGPIRCCGKTRLSGPSLVASYRQILRDKAGAVSHKAVCGQFPVTPRFVHNRLGGQIYGYGVFGQLPQSGLPRSDPATLPRSPFLTASGTGPECRLFVQLTGNSAGRTYQNQPARFNRGFSWVPF